MKTKLLAMLLVLVMMFVCIAMASSCGNGNTDTDTDTSTDTENNGDNATPSNSNVAKPVVKYLRIVKLGEDKVTVRFNAIGEGLKFDIRYSDKEINEDNFSEATPVANPYITSDKEARIAVIEGLKADADNKYFIGVKASATGANGTVYSELQTIRAGGIEIIQLDGTKMDAIYSGEVIKNFAKLIDEQTSSDPYHGIIGSLPTSKVNKYYWGAGERPLGSYNMVNETHSKYGMTLRPIIDLETEHYVDAIYLYYGNNSYPVQVNVSLDAANFDTIEDWDLRTSFGVDTPYSKDIVTAELKNKILSKVTYLGKDYTLTKLPILFNGKYDAENDKGAVPVTITFNDSRKTVEFSYKLHYIPNGETALKTVQTSVLFDFVVENGELKLYRAGAVDKDGNKIPVSAEHASITLDSNGIPVKAYFAHAIEKKDSSGNVEKDENNQVVYDYFAAGANYKVYEHDLGEVGNYVGVDANGNQCLKVDVNTSQIQDYKPATFTYIDPQTNAETSHTALYVVKDGVINFYEDQRPKTNGWTRIEIGREVRYVQIVYCDTTLEDDITLRYNSQAPVEVLVYGYATGEGDKISNSTQRELPTMGEFMGACGFTAGGGGNTTPVQLECFGVLREYINLGWVYNWANFPKKTTSLVASFMGNFDHNYGTKYKDLIIIPCLQWNESSNPARVYNRITGKLSAEIASEADKFKPETYAAYADMTFQYAARYGSCRMGYLKDAVKAHSMGVAKVGLNYLQWIELGNEPNGEDQNGTTPYQLAALTSASYDGHQKTILADVYNPDDFTYFFGGKNADPNFKIAMAGLAGIGSNYISSMVYWMKANRTDGCIAMDAFNVHTYFGKTFYLNGQDITVGVSPEEFGLIDAMAVLTEFRDKYYPNVEVWITEFGWDTNQSYETMTSAHAYGEYSGREVQAMWLARAYLLLSASGVDKATMYMVEDGIDDRIASGKYGTCGIYACEMKDTYDPETGKLIESEYTGKMVAKEAYYILYTMKRALRDMSYQRELVSGNDDVWIYEYADKDGNYGYALWCPTSNGTKVADYKLYVGDTDKKVTLISNNFEDHRAVTTEYGQVLEPHTYTINGDDTTLVPNNGYVSVNVSENPVYVIIGNVNERLPDNGGAIQ